MEIIVFTQNIAPFRAEWFKELSKYAKIKIFHVGEYERITNKAYRNYDVSGIEYINIAKKVLFFNVYNMKEVTIPKQSIVLLDGYGFMAQLVLIAKLKIKNIPYMLSIDGGIVPQKENLLKKKIKKICISSAERCFSTSKEADNFLIHYGANPEKIIRHHFSSIRNADIVKMLPSKYEVSQIRNELQLENKFTIIAVGSFIYRKGFDVLIEAIKYLNCDVQVIIIGAALDTKYSNDLIEKAPNCVKIIKFCDKEKLLKYYRASDVFILPTRLDVWGLVIGEAMSQGVPVITTNMCLSGVAMIQSGINGYIVETDDPIAIAAAANSLINNSEVRDSMGRQCLETMSRYTIEVAANEDIINLTNIQELL